MYASYSCLIFAFSPNTRRKLLDAASEAPKIYSRVVVPSIAHFINAMGIFCTLNARFTLQGGELSVKDQSLLAKSVVSLNEGNMLKMIISPLLYPTAVLLPKGKA